MLTPEPETFPQAGSHALAVHSLQTAFCTAEHHELPGFLAKQKENVYIYI